MIIGGRGTSSNRRERGYESVLSMVGPFKSREVLPAQPVDATPSNRLIREYLL